ncbi:hypothetical protein LCGC14_2458120 [marine sediment metagenome]|uniref:IrrE N-terminal-like domain-containing protein n=1 Tax=marine sediment metagenome TaxID=412755 RepID=A0A0F9DR71_9ZZZZ
MNRYEEVGNLLLKRHDVTIKVIRRSMSGLAYIKERAICSPLPRTAKSFAIFCHEVGHIAQGVIKPRWLEELRAEEFAKGCFGEFGFSMPKAVKDRMKYHISYKLAQALNRGMKHTPPELKSHRKYLAKVRCMNGKGETVGYVYRVDSRLIR